MNVAADPSDTMATGTQRLARPPMTGRAGDRFDPSGTSVPILGWRDPDPTRGMRTACEDALRTDALARVARAAALRRVTRRAGSRRRARLLGVAYPKTRAMEGARPDRRRVEAKSALQHGHVHAVARSAEALRVACVAIVALTGGENAVTPRKVEIVHEVIGRPRELRGEIDVTPTAAPRVIGLAVRMA